MRTTRGRDGVTNITRFEGAPRRHRTLFISDTHLGTRGAKVKDLADFLERNECETLYLVGDIIDGWQLKRGWYWNQAHTRAVELIMGRVERGTRVIYVPGNHDEMFRPFCGLTVAGIEIRHEDVHETADGRRMLVVHGDAFDGIVARAPWLAKFGAKAHGATRPINNAVARAGRRLGISHWSLAAFLKHAVKNAAQYVAKFERAVAAEVRSRGFDGVICGHIHHAAMKTIGGVLYCNDGDWVESCTALSEDHSGRLSIVRWAEMEAEAESEAAASPVPAAA